MRILFFSHYYPPEINAPASRTSEHCREWVRLGHEVTVITSAPNHPKGKLYPGYKNKLFQTEIIDGVKVVRVWTYLAANEGFLRRTLNYVSYMLTAVLAVPRLPRPDAYVSTSPQFFCGLAGLIAARMRWRPWVLEIRDLWPESIISVGAMRKGLVIRVLEWLERLGYRKADRIVTVTDSFVPHIAARCQDDSKIDVIKNGVDLSLFRRGSDSATAKRKLGVEGRFVAAYVGTHGMAHGLDTLLDAAAALKGDPLIAFLMVGDGAEQARLAARVASERLDNVRIVGQLPKTRMPDIWAATDVSLILLKRSDTFQKVLPSKMFEAMAMEVPIVLGVEGEARALLEAAGAGIAITPESVEELAGAVVRLRDEAALAASCGRQGVAFVREHFDRARLARRYIDVLEDAIAAGRCVSSVSREKTRAS
jgi:glycosyltransferase involved in cell wall biosynthesis